MDSNFINRIRDWNLAAGNTADQFNVRQTARYIGLILEEVSELLDSLEDAHDIGGGIAFDLHELSMKFRRGEHNAAIEACDRVAMLDALCDIMVVTTGGMMSIGADIHGALDEVCASNESKSVECVNCLGCGQSGAFVETCPDCDGRGWILQKDETGKIIKGKNYCHPSLPQFLKG